MEAAATYSCRNCEHFDEFRPIPTNQRASASRCDHYAQCKAEQSGDVRPPYFSGNGRGESCLVCGRYTILGEGA